MGETRRQAPLQCDTRICFAKGVASGDGNMQVDIFARVSSSQIQIDPSREVYDLNIDSEGFANLALRVRGQEGMLDSSRQLADTVATDGYIGQQNNKFSTEAVGPIASNFDETASSVEERLRCLRANATDYIERYNLRERLQTMFQQVIKNRPDNPIQFMISFLREECGGGDGPSSVSEPQPPPPPAAAVTMDSPAGVVVASVEADAVEEARRADRERHHEQQIEWQLAEIELLQRRIQELEATVASALAPKVHDADRAASPVNTGSELRLRYEEQIAAQRAQIDTLELRLTQMDATAETAAATAIQTKASGADGAGGVIGPRSSVDTVVGTAPGPGPLGPGRATPADEAAGGIGTDTARVQPNSASAHGLTEAQSLPSGPPWDTSGSGGTANGSACVESTSGGGPQWASATATTMAPASVGSEVNTHILSQLIASTYAPSVPPTTYFEPREDKGEDLILPGKPLMNPELLVEVVECLDSSTNGTFAWVGDCNKRPLYRLLGPEPRYLYYASVDPTWAGWWIADKMGSEDYVEWFRDPSDAKLPVYCKKGELGSRIVEVELTQEVVQKISTISNQPEKSTIRSKLTEAFGAQFTKLEGTQRGLMSKTSPVVAVAHALEAQQRAIQLLHSQLSSVSKRCQAAEAHAQTMEEAFDTLQLRIQAQLPGNPRTAHVAKAED